MASNEKNFDVVRRYHFRKNGVVDSQGYDWIGEARYGLYPVELDGKPFKELQKNRDRWAKETCFIYPGPIQYWGPSEVCDVPTKTLVLEQE